MQGLLAGGLDSSSLDNNTEPVELAES
jgi:hypothetical protein